MRLPSCVSRCSTVKVQSTDPVTYQMGHPSNAAEDRYLLSSTTNMQDEHGSPSAPEATMFPPPHGSPRLARKDLSGGYLDRFKGYQHCFEGYPHLHVPRSRNGWRYPSHVPRHLVVAACTGLEFAVERTVPSAEYTSRSG